MSPHSAGDGERSWAYESTGRAFTNSEVKDYGKEFVEKDVVGAYVVSIVIVDIFLTDLTKMEESRLLFFLLSPPIGNLKKV